MKLIGIKSPMFARSFGLRAPEDGMKNKSVKVDVRGSLLFGEVVIKLPDNGDKNSKSYLWFGADDQFLGSIEKKKTLLTLREMINEVLESL